MLGLVHQKVILATGLHNRCDHLRSIDALSLCHILQGKLSTLSCLLSLLQ